MSNAVAVDRPREDRASGVGHPGFPRRPMPDAPPVADAELTTLLEARSAYEAFTTLPADGHRALADHVQQTLPPLRQAYSALQQEAAALIKDREDAWSPVALELAEWLRKAELADEAEPKLTVASEAMKWLQDNATELRNQRIEPLRAMSSWAPSGW